MDKRGELTPAEADALVAIIQQRDEHLIPYYSVDEPGSVLKRLERNKLIETGYFRARRWQDSCRVTEKGLAALDAYHQHQAEQEECEYKLKYKFDFFRGIVFR